MSQKYLCPALRLLSAAAGGALIIYAFAARGEGDGMDIGSVIDVSLLFVLLLATTLLVGVLTPAIRDLRALRWEVRELRTDLRDGRQQILAAQPSAKAIGGHLAAVLFANDEDDEAGADVVNLRRTR